MTNEEILEEVKVILGLKRVTDIYGNECNSDNSEIIPQLINTLAQLKAEKEVNLENYKKIYSEANYKIAVYKSRLVALGGKTETF